MNNQQMSIVCGSALIAATSGGVFAADMAVKALPPALPSAVWDWSGFYIGTGGSFNWSHFDQSLQGVSGTINVSTGPVLVARGQEGGPFFDFNRKKSGFAPDVQLGYMVPFPGGDWLAGLATGESCPARCAAACVGRRTGRGADAHEPVGVAALLAGGAHVGAVPPRCGA
jgi:hypothetical protein